MRRSVSALPLLLLIAAASGPSQADETGLRRCRGVAEAAARLACYDALPLATAPQAVPPQGVAAPGPEPVRGPPRAPPQAVERSSAAEFGLAPRAPADEPTSIESHIPGAFAGWRPNERIRLANGQVWQIVDDTSRFLDRRDPKVTVRRGALGAFYLDIEGDNRSPRVRRVQ